MSISRIVVFFFLLGFIFLEGKIVAQELSVIYPKDDQHVSSSAQYRWNAHSLADFYSLKINAVINGISSTDSVTMVNKNTYPIDNVPGSYEWKVYAIRADSVIDSSEISRFLIFNPGEVDSLSFWVKADTGITLTNGFVSDWEDLSDSSVLVSQSNTSRRPTIENNALNGYPAVNFDDIDDQLLVDANMQKANYSISLVYNSRVNTGAKSVFLGKNVWAIGPHGGTHRIIAGNITVGPPVIAGRYVVHTAYVVNDTVTNYVNGQDRDQKLATKKPGTSFTFASTPALNGNIAEAVIVNGAISDSIRDNIDSYLMDKYAPPVNLGEDRRICSFPDSIELDLDYALDYNWSTGDTASTLVVDSAGKYYVTITDIFERQTTDSIFFILDTADFQADFGFEDTTICKGTSLELSIGRPIYEHNWNTGDTVFSILADSVGMYKVTLKNCLGNVSSDSIELFINEPRFNLGIDTTVCFNQLITLESDSSFTNVDYQWSTGDTTVSILADTSANYTLMVIDKFNCSFIDSINLTIDSNLFNVSLGPDTSLCAGNPISLQNPPMNLSSYLWSTGSIESDEEVDTAGLYTLEFSDGLCTASDSVNILVKGEAPTAEFLASNFCFQDTVIFNDVSFAPAADTILEWRWEFGDGRSSINQNTEHEYGLAGKYTVNLEVVTNKNCSDTINKIITVHPKPIADFGSDANIACSKNPVVLLDSSFVSSGDIAGYFWDFGDTLNTNNTSNNRNPNHVYDTLGTYMVRLVVETVQGCLDTIVRSKQINATPNVKFDFNGHCLNDSTKFIDQTILPIGEIRDYFWAVNGEVSIKKNPSFKFLSSGEHSVVFRVRTVEGCQSIIRENVEIFENPVADFMQLSACESIPISIKNESSGIDSIIEYRYIFDNRDTSLLIDPNFEALATGVFPLQLTIIDDNLCIDSITKSIIVNPDPEAIFDLKTDEAGIPFRLELTNRSTDASTYLWNFGDGDSSDSFEPEHIYRDTGNFKIQLKVESDQGCVDSISQEITVLPFFIDAAVEQLDLIEDAFGAVQVRTRLINTGNNTIESVHLTADVNNEFQFRETFDQTIYRGRGAAFVFASNFIEEKGRKLDFVCLRIELVNGQPDSLTENNELCEKGFSRKLTLNVFPNPVSDLLNFEFVLPETGNLEVRFYDQLGREVHAGQDGAFDEGFYITQFNIASLKSGMYHYTFTHNGSEMRGTFIKQ